MADKENAPTSRKRVAGTQINKDNPEPDDDAPEQEMGTFQKASEEVMAIRRIVKVRRQQQPSSPSSNPFSAIRFTPSDSSVEMRVPSTETQPQGVTADPNVKDSSCSKGKTDEGINGNGKDALSDADKHADSTEVSETRNDESGVGTKSTQKDESGMETKSTQKDESVVDTKSNSSTEAPNQHVETRYKAENERNGSGSEAKGLGREFKEDTGKIAEVGGETKDGETEEKKGTNEAGDGDETSKDHTERKDGDESKTKDGSSEEQKDADKKGQSSSSTPLFSFQNLSSSQNAFTGLAGTGFSSSPFSFGSVSKERSQFANAGPAFGLKSDGSSFPSISFSAANNGSSSTAFATAVEVAKKIAMPQVPVETGEENEKAVFTADAVLYEYFEGGWKERGKGELKLNIPVSGDERARLIMRAKGNYRLILNASLYADMSLKDMDKKGVTFTCANCIGETQSGLSALAVKFKDASIREEFSAAVSTHKTIKASDALKTPENSPKASND